MKEKINCMKEKEKVQPKNQKKNRLFKYIMYFL